MADIKIDTLKDRIALVKRACFNGKRIVIFSGGVAKSDEEILSEIKEIHAGGGNGSIMGRNAFQRKKPDAIKLLGDIINIYKS